MNGNGTEKARIQARPGAPRHAGQIGLQVLPFSGERDSYLYVPALVRSREASPLMVLLHGAGGHAHQSLQLLKQLADDFGLIMLAPASSTYTWDVVVEHYGEDVALIDRFLGYVFERYSVDLRRVGMAGFSDGASYALSLGMTNGDLFTHLIAFSPGFAAPAALRGLPAVFVSHGVSDTVLPVTACSRNLVPRLRRGGLSVEYREFEGGHEVPGDIVEAAVRWFLTR